MSDDLPLLNQRYKILKLIGKGGFGEVYKAFDLDQLKKVACKINILNPIWSKEVKDNVIKHVTRENLTHLTLKHPNIVRQFEYFHLNSDNICQVLEYCKGLDLDLYLKKHKQISEKEAKEIIS